MNDEINAIILAAGQSKSFSPYFYDIPKGLLKVKGEVLIERQIRQLKDAGIHDITIVVGYLREKFFYLQEKYSVSIICNTQFLNNGNIYSLYLARNKLKNTFICCPDQYFIDNPFVHSNSEIAWRQTQYINGVNKEFSIKKNMNNRITTVKLGGYDCECMVGCAFFNNQFSKQFKFLLEKEIQDFGVSSMFWEQFYYRHIDTLDLYSKEIKEDSVVEFDELFELMEFDETFIRNVNSTMFDNISKTLKCNKEDILEIVPIKKGLTNISFKFKVKNKYYVYRHPGISSDNLVNRKSEAYAENLANKIGINETMIDINQEEGWKISYFMNDCRDFDWHNPLDRKKGIDCIRKLHNVKSKGNYVFDTFEQSKKLLNIAKNYRGNLFDEFEELYDLIMKLNKYIEDDEFPKCVCHNDTYAVNYLINNSDISLIDWEYSGYNDPANDIACILARDSFSDDEIDVFLEDYFGRKLTFIEYRHYISYIGLCSFYWFTWALYKDSMGDDEIFMLNGYNLAYKYGRIGIDMYEHEEEYL